MKEKKESRLSFRITPELSTEIDGLIQDYKEIKDRSDFGTKAIKLYLSYLNEDLALKDIITSSIMAIAEETKHQNLPEIRQLVEFLEQKS